MSFDEIKGFNINNNPAQTPKKKEQDNSVAANSQAPKQTENSPANPQYWQSTMKINQSKQSFRGNIGDKEPCSDEYLKQAEEKLKKILNNTWYTSSNIKESVLNKLYSLKNQGKNAVDNYVYIMSKMQKDSDRYAEMSIILADYISDMEENELNTYSDLFNSLVFKSNDVFDIVKEDFNKMLCDKSANKKTKLLNYSNIMKNAPVYLYDFEQFNEMTNILVNNANLLNPEQAEKFSDCFNLMRGTSSKVCEDIKKHYEYVFADKSGNKDDKTDWLYVVSISEIFEKDKFDINDSYEKNFSAFTSLMKKIPCISDKMNLFACNINPNNYKKLSELSDKGVLNFNSFLNFVNIIKNDSNGYSLYRARNAVESICSNENKCNTFNILMQRNNNCSSIEAVQIGEILAKDDEIVKPFLEYFAEEQSKDKNLLAKPSFFIRILNSLDKNNVDDFISAIKGQSIYQMYDMATRYLNPNTGKFDVHVYNHAIHFQQALDISEFMSKEIAAEMVDKSTGEVSPIAEDAIKYICLDENPVRKKFIDATKKFLPKSKRRAQVRENFKEQLSEILKSLKDNDGNYNEKNWIYLKKLLRKNSEKYTGYYYLHEFLNQTKDNNGVVDAQKYDFGVKILKNIQNYSAAAEILKSFNSHIKTDSKSKKEDIFTFMKSLDIMKKLSVDDFRSILKYCFDEDGTLKKENVSYVREIMSSSKNNLHLNFTDDFFEMSELSADNKAFTLELLKNSSDISLNELAAAFKLFKTDKGTFPEEVKQNIRMFINLGLRIESFCDIHNACYETAPDGTQVFSQKMFDKTIEMLKDYGGKLLAKEYMDPAFFVVIANNNLQPGKYDFKTRVQMLELLDIIKKYISNPEKYEYLDKMKSDLDFSLNSAYNSMPVDKADRENFITNVLKINPSEPNKLTPFEKVITDSIPQIENMVNGIPLSYSREEFLADISDICNKDKTAVNTIQNKTGIDLITKANEDGETEITGYNGLISLENLDKNNETESAIYNCMHKFLYSNSVKTGNNALDEQLNYIIKAFPEFINSIGKKQHGTHKYTLDVHQLLVLAYSMNNPGYLKNLNGKDKTILKVSSLFHDITKKENEVDKGHQNVASVYARNIAKKVIKNSDTTDRVYDIVNNHHWLQEYNTASDKTKISRELAYRFRRPNDFEIAKIMADADLKAVSEDFYNAHKSALANTSEVENNLKKLYATGNALFTDYIISPSKLEAKKEIRNGKEYKVINLHKIDDEADMAEYGFNHVKKKDLNFLVHMVDKHYIYNSLNKVKLLTSPINGGVLSESLITPNHTRTYCNRKYGVLLSQLNANIVNEANCNQGSGNEKDFDRLLELIFSEYGNDARMNFRKELLDKLHIEENSITDDDYAKFYKDVLAAKRSLLEIAPSKKYNIGKYSFTGEELQNAIKQYQNSLLRTDIDQHNEIVGFIPKIQAVVSKSESLADVPSELLKFAEDNDLPVMLI